MTAIATLIARQTEAIFLEVSILTNAAGIIHDIVFTHITQLTGGKLGTFKAVVDARLANVVDFKERNIARTGIIGLEDKVESRVALKAIG